MSFAALALCALSLAAVLWFFVMHRREMWQRDRTAREEAAGASAAIAAVRAEIEALRARFLELEERTGMLVTPPPIRSGLNMGRRTQAVRMLHRGDTPEQIAAAVGLPLAEARLLSTVERLRSSEPNRPPALQ